jgi:Ca2+-binding RTX toxin-like protein
MDDTVAGSGYGSPYVDSLIWGCGWARDFDNPTGPLEIAVHFGMPGEDDANFSGFAQPWDARQMDAFRAAFQLYENVANIDFVEDGSFATADMIEWLVPQTFFGDTTLGAHEVPDPSETIAPPYGYYNTSDSSWSNLSQGGFGFITVIHELGHALGLAHPHDGGDKHDELDASVFPGVTPNNTRDTGDFGLNQGIWTVMTYNDGWSQVPPVSEDYGYEGTPMAFDIAALQEIYGANTTYHAGNDTYLLPTMNGPGTFWSCIWDAGGDDDEISAAASMGSCTINLNAATLQAHDPHAGGYVSWVSSVIGGFTIANGVVIEKATGGALNDTLIGNQADNVLTGNAGNDSLDGGFGADNMFGGIGGDTYVVDNLGDKITDAADSAIDLVRSSINFVLADANLDNLTLTDVSDIDGTGNANANLLIGNAGANILDGLGGADTMQGGAGNDTYVLDVAGEIVGEDKAAGLDTVLSKQSYTLGSNLENLVLLAAALTATGNELANHLTGNDEANTLDGKAGADTMTGGKGDDVYYMDVATDQIDETGGEGKDEVHSAVALKTVIADVEDYVFTGKIAVNFLADGADNKIVATAAADTLDGAGGNDTLQGGIGNDIYMVGATTDVVIEDSKQGTDLVKSSDDFALGPNVENLTLTGGGAIDGTGNELPNIIIGNVGANKLSGADGSDTLTGGDGNDTLIGGTGNDIMTGGNNNDIYDVDSKTDRVTESAAAGGYDTVDSAITYTLGIYLEELDLTKAGVANGTGNTSANLIIGSAAANILDGKTGADTMKGGDGNDTYVIDNLKDVADEGGGSGIDTLVRPFATSLDLAFAAFENLTLTGTALTGTGNAAANAITGNGSANTLNGLDDNDTLVGAAGNDSLTGGIGDDSLDGGTGSDKLIGGIGNDTYVIDNAKDVVQESGGAGVDLINSFIAIDLAGYAEIEDVTLMGAGALKATGDEQGNHLTGNTGANLLSGNVGADTLVGGAGNDTLLGGADADSLAGGDGNDSLDGGADTDADSLAGGLGNDTYLIADAGNIVTEDVLAGTDTVRSSLASYTLDANVENLVLLADMTALAGTGNGLGNLLTGNDVDNTLDGGGGIDTLIGGKGNDSFFVDETKDVVIEAAGAGTDTVTSTAVTYTLGANFENLVLDTGALGGTGNTLNNTLTGNGDDNTLDGKVGKDHMIGGVGSDTYVVDNVGDVVDELSGGPTDIDTVNSSIAFSLLAGATVRGSIENLTLTGAGAISGTGNELANHLIGNAGANALFGGGENDTIDGGGGNDIVTGGAGDDHINVGTGNDTVRYTSTVDGHDVIDNFDGTAGGGQDVLNLDVLFDSLGILAADRAVRVSTLPSSGSVDVHVDVSALHDGSNVITVATLNLANPADLITVGQDIVVGT